MYNPLSIYKVGFILQDTPLFCQERPKFVKLLLKGGKIPWEIDFYPLQKVKKMIKSYVM